MVERTFFCIDGHTCGNPVRVVAGGAPPLKSTTASDRRLEFVAEHDWIRTGLMFEPRGHDMMSGTVLYPPTRDDCDLGLVYIETTGCLPMCGHGTIGTVTIAVEKGLVQPRVPGQLRLDTPAGLVIAEYRQSGPYVDAVKITNIPSFLLHRDMEVSFEGIGRSGRLDLRVDVAYGGNFYAIIEPQDGFGSLDEMTPADILAWSPLVRARMNEIDRYIHPENPAIQRLTHVMWTGTPKHPEAHGRNAVFYGDKAIDRSPCGTGTSARMAQRVARGLLDAGGAFVHESIIGSLFTGRVEGLTTVGHYAAIIPSIEGWARVTGYNTILLDDRDPFMKGFSVT